MVRRIAIALIVLATCVATVVLTAATDESRGKLYKAEFDNAFGLTEGGDLRIGGVQAGQTTSFSISDSEPHKAVVEFTISEPGFDSLREDARCDVRQQSLIGEYYVDCQPGTSETELEEGGTIPVEQTASIIPADLVNNVLRRPYRERLRLIIAELGTGLAGRPEDLAATLERAHPGLRETNQTLAILRDQTQVLRDFVSDSNAVIDDLAANRQDVVRFVDEAGETAEISATRKEELAEQFEKLPRFLAELDPTMLRLGQLADAQVPLLADLRAASGDLERFFTELGPFAQASRPALRSLGNTSVTGEKAIRESKDEIRELKAVARGAGGVGRPLRKFLQTLDDRGRAYETDLRTPNTDPPKFDRESLGNRKNRRLTARGFTGYENLLNYLFWQTLSINAFDGLSHVLRGLLVIDEQAPACTPINVNPDRAEIEECHSYLGPKQPGVGQATGVIRGKDFGSADRDPTLDDRRRLRSGAQSASTQSTGDGVSAQGNGSSQREDGAETGAKGEAGASSPLGGLPSEVDKLLDDLREGARGDGAGAQGSADDLGKAERKRLREELRLRRQQDGEALDGEALNGQGVGAEALGGDLVGVRSEARGAEPAAPISDDTAAELLDFLLGP